MWGSDKFELGRFSNHFPKRSKFVPKHDLVLTVTVEAKNLEEFSFIFEM